MSESKCVYLAVEDHPAGRYTLTMKDRTMPMQQDFKGELRMNLDQECFFSAVGKGINRLALDGSHNIVLKY